MTTQKFTQDQLNKTLWAAADSSRSFLDAGVYKNYVLIMLFYKYLSDLFKKQEEKFQKRFGGASRVRDKLRTGRFYLPLNTSFDYIYNIIEQDNIGEELNKVLAKIEDENKQKLEGILTSLDFNSENTLGKLDQRNKMIRHLIHDFYKIDLSEADDDIIGNAYMYLIEKFGADSGKKAGEFFTVKCVAKLLAKLSEPKEFIRNCNDFNVKWIIN